MPASLVDKDCSAGWQHLQQQAQEVQTMQDVDGPARVVVGQRGLDSLAQPHLVAPL